MLDFGTAYQNGVRKSSAARLSRAAQNLQLRGATLGGGDAVFDGQVHRNGILKAVENLIRGVLEAGIGLVQLASSLGSKLTELIAVIHVRESTKDQI
jgi:hypothetical protein